jgi:succinoglycan biosynthesis protein ExoM
MMMQKKEHISVCILSYKRPMMLGRCLKALQLQESIGFTFSIEVVDNDKAQSAKDIVNEWQIRSAIKIQYDVVPEQNISLARNRAVSNAHGNLIAFIDDDEFPEKHWLQRLFDAYMRFSVDGVLGPVIPLYAGTPPEWLIRSELCVRSSFRTGTILDNLRFMRTGNVLLGRHIFNGCKAPFDPQFGRTGGEDYHFFNQMLRAGHSFAWCDEAPVYEEVPVERQRLGYFVRRAFIRGVTQADDEPFVGLGTLKSLIAVFIYSASLPVFLVTEHHLFVRYFIKNCDHFSKLCAHCGLRIVRERTF